MSDEVSYPGQDFRGSRAGRYGMGPIRPERRGFSPDTQRLMMFFGGVVVVVGALAGIASFTGHHHGGVPVIAADPRPYREKPADPGGLKIDAAESDVFGGDTDTANSKLAPTAEAPDQTAFRSAEQLPPAAATATAAPIVAPAASPPIPAATDAASVQPRSELTAEPPAKTTVASVQPAHPAPAPKPAVAAETQTPRARSTVVATATPMAAKPAPAATVARAAGNNAETAHKTMIQLAAVGSEDAAKAEWQRLLHRYPELARHQPAFSRIEHDGKTFWRVRAAGFADIAQARAFCEQVRGKGGGCSVADF